MFCLPFLSIFYSAFCVLWEVLYKTIKHLHRAIAFTCTLVVCELKKWHFLRDHNFKGVPLGSSKRQEKEEPPEPTNISLSTVLFPDLIEYPTSLSNDVKSINYYKKVARCVPDNIIYRAIAEVKETSSLGEVKKSTGSIFTHLIKKYAAELGINL